ncbi:MAG: Hsp70 family protein [Deltaproteobacteria bacterium]|nr:Hsp70 family protein [Deltaproteobacteria bacterium]
MRDVDEFAGCAVGIDLGTTNTVVAASRNGEVELIRNRDGGYLHPSVVAFTPSGARLVGDRARRRRALDPENTIFSAKRLIGRRFSSADVQDAVRRYPYRIAGGRNDETIVNTRAGEVPVVEISSYVLEHVKELAEAQLDQAVTQCVVTVPAHFGDAQRTATRRAAERAGFDVLRILNEPTAAALAYGLKDGTRKRIAIFDLGGGTFDVTVLAIEGHLFEVLATGGHPYLGGDNIDQALAEMLADEFEASHGIVLAGQRHARGKLLQAAESIKRELSEHTSCTGSLEELAYGEGGVALELDYQITRAQLEGLASPLLDRAIGLVEKVLADAETAPTLIDEVLLVGGSTKIPLVRRRVEEAFLSAAKAAVDPMLAVAAGAAIQAEFLSDPPDARDGAPLLMDVAAHGIGVVTAGRFNEPVIEKNTPIPAVRTRVFSPASDNQTTVEIRVCESDRRQFTSEQELGTLRLEGLPPGRRGDTEIEVSFTLDSDGILQVAAKDRKSGRSQSAILTVSGLAEQ